MFLVDSENGSGLKITLGSLYVEGRKILRRQRQFAFGLRAGTLATLHHTHFCLDRPEVYAVKTTQGLVVILSVSYECFHNFVLLAQRLVG